jgi:hypothetical protein
MRIAYMSTDEVNQELATQMAAKSGATVCGLLPQGPPPGGLFDAVLYNLDDMPKAQRSALVARLRRGEVDHPTAVHGYDITEEQAGTLCQCGVVAARHLNVGLFRNLLEEARRRRKAAIADSEPSDLTWVDLVR